MPETKIVGLKYRGKFLGIEPGTEAVYADRDACGGWEKWALTKRDDGRYNARAVDANRALCITDDGRLESRPATSMGAWETCHGAKLPPDDYPVLSRQGVSLEVVFL